MARQYAIESSVQWGHYAALIILSALAGAYQPHYLIYVGLARWAWCVLGGRAARGFVAAVIFLVAYGVLLVVNQSAAERSTSSGDAPSAPALQHGAGR